MRLMRSIRGFSHSRRYSFSMASRIVAVKLLPFSRASRRIASSVATSSICIAISLQYLTDEQNKWTTRPNCVPSTLLRLGHAIVLLGHHVVSIEPGDSVRRAVGVQHLLRGIFDIAFEAGPARGQMIELGALA